MKKEQLYANGQPIEPEIDLSGYVKKESGKGLSEHDFSTGYKEKIESVEERAQRNTVTGIKGAAETTYRTGDINITKDNMGLGNVENKSSKEIRQDMTREDVTNALQYTPEIEGAYENATAYTNTKIAELINGAPETLDTLKEVADAIQENKTVADALDAAIGRKANQSELDTHTGNNTIHITAGERTKYNGVVDILGNVKGMTDSAEVSDSHILATSTAVNQVFQSVSSGKRIVASAITGKGIETAADATFQAMADNIESIVLPTGNATAAQVLTGHTFSNASAVGIAGTMVNRGAVNTALNAGGAYTIPAGFHNGSGKVTANSLAGQTAATAAAANITSGKTAWVNGVKVTGTGGDNTVQYNAGYSAGSSAAQPTGNATAAQVLTGYTFSNGSGKGIAGTMANRGAVSTALNAGGAYTIPAGFHNGSGKITANSLTSQTAATAAAANITSGKTAWVNGVKITGTGGDNTANYNSGYNTGVAAADGRANANSVNYKTGYNAGYSAGQSSAKLRRFGYFHATQSGNASQWPDRYANKSLFNLSSVNGYRNLIFGSNAMAIVSRISTGQANTYVTGWMDGDQVNTASDISWNSLDNANYPNNASDPQFGHRLIRFWYNPNSGNLYAMAYATVTISSVIIYTF